MASIQELTMAMIGFDTGDARRIQHFLKVHAFAKAIALGERVNPETLEILEAAALTHDIGIHPAEKKYGYCNGKLQEQEGPAHAEKMLGKLGYPKPQIERICYLIAHHHTYTNVEGLDYRILLEADFLVNLYEDQAEEKAIAAAKESVFRTKTGLWLLEQQFPAKE